MIHYEHPLNERVRALLRLEHLFLSSDHALHDTGEWGSRAAFNSLFDLLDLAGRNEIRQELGKELDKQGQALEKMRSIPGINVDALNQTLGDIRTADDSLNSSFSAPGQALKDDELLMAVRQRHSVPGGTCAFDLPELHRWLNGPVEQKQADLNRWFAEFNGVRQATECLLRLIRGSANSADKVAEEGFFQMELDSSKPLQLIKVSLDPSVDCYPEISGGKHRVTIRFMQNAPQQRAMQIHTSIGFRLACSLL